MPHMATIRFATGLLLPVCLAASLSGLLHAQTVPAPGTILKQNTLPAHLPVAPANPLVLPSPSTQKANASLPIPVKRIVIKGNTLLPSTTLQTLVSALQERTVTLADLQQAAERITAFYQSRGYPLARAYVPAQTVRHGLVRIAIVEPRYDHIELQDQSRLNPATAHRTLGLSSGQTITQAAFDRGMLLLNRTPGVRVAGTLVPGARPDTSSLQVKLTDTPVLHAQLHMDNDGSTYTGRTRGSADLYLDNPFGQGTQLAVNGLTTSAGLLHAGGFNLTSPDLYDGLRAGLYGSRTHYRLGGAFAALGIHGRVNQAGLDLDAPLVLAPGRLLEARLDLLRTSFAQHAASGTDSRSHIRMARLSLDGALADADGVTSGGISLDRGQLSMDSPDARRADVSGSHAAGDFWVGQLQVQRNQALPRRWHLQATFSAQLASRALDGSEQFYLGGPYAVMSAPVNAAGGDAGALLRLRLSHPLLTDLDGAVLLQSGVAWLRGTPQTAASYTHLSGAGLGLDYHWSTRLYLRMAYVHTLGARPAAGSAANGQWWARLTVTL